MNGGLGRGNVFLYIVQFSHLSHRTSAVVLRYIERSEGSQTNWQIQAENSPGVCSTFAYEKQNYLLGLIKSEN